MHQEPLPAPCSLPIPVPGSGGLGVRLWQQLSCSRTRTSLLPVCSVPWCALEARRAASPRRAHRAGHACVFHLSVSPCLSLCLCRQAELALLWSLSSSSGAWVLGSSLRCGRLAVPGRGSWALAFACTVRARLGRELPRECCLPFPPQARSARPSPAAGFLTVPPPGSRSPSNEARRHLLPQLVS